MKESSLFHSLEDSLIEGLLLSMDLETWKKGKSILETENFVKNAYFILKGRIKISVTHPENGREQTLFLYNEGDLFDVVAFLDRLPTEGIVTSMDDVQLLRIRSSELKIIIFESRPLGHSFFSYLGKQLRELENLTIDLSIHDVPTRLVKQILKHADHNTNKGPLKLIHDFTHEEIANLIGSSRVVVNRILQALKKEGHIDFHRGHIEINDAHKLLQENEEKFLKPEY